MDKSSLGFHPVLGFLCYLAHISVCRSFFTKIWRQLYCTKHRACKKTECDISGMFLALTALVLVLHAI